MSTKTSKAFKVTSCSQEPTHRQHAKRISLLAATPEVKTLTVQTAAGKEVMKQLDETALHCWNLPQTRTKTAATAFVKTPAKTSIHHPAQPNPTLSVKASSMKASRICNCATAQWSPTTKKRLPATPATVLGEDSATGGTGVRSACSYPSIQLN